MSFLTKQASRTAFMATLLPAAFVMFSPLAKAEDAQPSPQTLPAAAQGPAVRLPENLLQGFVRIPAGDPTPSERDSILNQVFSGLPGDLTSQQKAELYSKLVECLCHCKPQQHRVVHHNKPKVTKQEEVAPPAPPTPPQPPAPQEVWYPVPVTGSVYVGSLGQAFFFASGNRAVSSASAAATTIFEYAPQPVLQPAPVPKPLVINNILNIGIFQPTTVTVNQPNINVTASGNASGVASGVASGIGNPNTKLIIKDTVIAGNDNGNGAGAGAGGGAASNLKINNLASGVAAPVTVADPTTISAPNTQLIAGIANKGVFYNGGLSLLQPQVPSSGKSVATQYGAVNRPPAMVVTGTHSLKR